MSQSVYFNGELITIPGAYATVEVSGMSTKSDVGAKTIAIIGECTGGEPGAVQFFSEPTTARKVLKSGELLKACEKAWNPVSQTKSGVALGGANVIACIRSNKATKSKVAIQKFTHDQLTFESKDWGANTNHQIKIQDGKLKGTKSITVYDQANDFYESFTDVGNAFTLNYTGDQKYAELNIFVDGDSAMYFQTKVGNSAEDAQEDIKLNLNATRFKTLSSLIYELQSYENYLVSAESPYNSKLKITDLDFVSKALIKLDSDVYRVTAIYADIKSQLEMNSQLVELVKYDKTQGEIENFDYTALEGGTTGDSPASWVPYFDKLSNYDISYIVPLTSDESIHAELASHINEMSGNLGRERRGIIGGAIGETVTKTIQRARSVSSDRIQVVHGGFWDVNSNNDLELYSPYILAAQHAGRASFLEDGEAATHDVYRMSAPEYKLERTEIVQLIQSGVLAFEFVLGKNNAAQSYVRLIQDLTTDTTSTDSLHTERAVGALADSINKQIRESLDALLTGKRTIASDLTSAKNKVISILDERKRKGHIIEYKDVTVVKSGTVIEVDYSVAPAEPNNFTLITAHYYSETISA